MYPIYREDFPCYILQEDVSLPLSLYIDISHLYPFNTLNNTLNKTKICIKHLKVWHIHTYKYLKQNMSRIYVFMYRGRVIDDVLKRNGIYMRKSFR